MSYTGQNPTFVKIRLTPLSADPPNPVEGDIQFSDGTARTEGLWIYKAGSWSQSVDVSIFEYFLSSNTTLTSFFADQYVQANATSASFAVTLPTAIGNSGRKLEVKKIDSSTNTVTISPSFGQSIDGLSSYVLSNQYDAVSILSNESNWIVLNKLNTVNSLTAQTFLVNGTYVVPSTKTVLSILGAGGGGGGGGGATAVTGGGGGGGAGAMPTVATINVVPGETLTISIGAGGTGGSSTSGSSSGGNAGSGGGNTTITGSSSGLLLTMFGANPGIGGGVGSGAGGAGGANLITNGSLTIAGGAGGGTGTNGNANIYQAAGGIGGVASSHGAGGGGGAGLGAAGNGGAGGGGSGNNGGTSSGGGGGGANGTGGPSSGAGGNGGNGFVTIYY